ncbi:hypothetical protein [Terrabacter sp. Soil810]|uniref:hypothetical protein n=1 Tax=Terrabacter sp. Soil810 TaxID=1736418 RepID=UPI000710382B|nr:hypothetical protein [Terrabacter sp. Soil810]KRF46284.1 hypothetical protein ASG96_20555 [Terrabacter sp. Soil810]
MSLHIGDITSEVRVEGPVPTGGPPAGGAQQPAQPWDLIERHRLLDEEMSNLRRRTDSEGFDG